jgi:hypothetical protein
MGIVNSDVHTVGVERRKFGSSDRDAREILCEKSFFHVLVEGVWTKNSK